MNYSVYCHVFPNGKRYIGITSQPLEYRWNEGRGYQYQPLIFRAIRKYGWCNIDHVILAKELSEEAAKELEKFYISKYKTSNKQFGYNLTLGGEGHLGYSPTAETREKLSKSNRGKKRTENFRQQCSERAKNQVMLQETKDKISESLKKRGNSFVTPEYREKLSSALLGNKNAKGTVQSAEANQRRSEALKGIVRSEETKAKMRKPKSKEALENMKRASQLRWEKYYEEKMSQSDSGRVGR